MQIALAFPVNDEAMDPASFARAAEDRQYESLWFPDHTHIPVERRSAWPGGPTLPRHYYRTFDPFVALSIAAAVTTTIKLATGVCLLVERDPIITAKEIASLDHLSGGRFVFGVGGGWNIEEMENHGVDPSHRFKLLREKVLAMKAIWTDDEASYHGDLVTVQPAFSWPKPIQRPHPPVLIGGDAPNTFARIVSYGDGWIKMADDRPDQLASRVTQLRQMGASAGRGYLSVTAFASKPTDDELQLYRDATVDRCIIGLPSAASAKIIELLDRYQPMIERFAEEPRTAA